MLSQINNFIVAFMDLLLNWMLQFPRIWILVFLGFAEALILTLIPKFTTNQDMLKRGKFDKIRLKELLKEAKQKGDKDAIKRYRTTIGSIGTISLKAQGLPLVVSLVPILFIALWAFSRIAYESPRAGDNIIVRAYFPAAQIGNLAHLVPVKGLEAKVPVKRAEDLVPEKPIETSASPNGAWIQRIVEDKDTEGKVVDGYAIWVVHCTEGGGRFPLKIRYKGQTVEKALLVGDHLYEQPLSYYSEGAIQAVEIAMPEYKPLGIIPGIPIPGAPWLAFPAWLVGYMIIVVPLAFALKPLLRVY